MIMLLVSILTLSWWHTWYTQTQEYRQTCVEHPHSYSEPFKWYTSLVPFIRYRHLLACMRYTDRICYQCLLFMTKINLISRCC